MSDDKFTRPDLKISVEREAGPYEIFMSYGMELDLRRLLPDPSSALQLLREDVFTQDYCLRRALTPSKKMIQKPEELVPEEEVDLNPDDVERVLMWIADHALYFFVKRMSGLAELGNRYEKALPNPSSNGSETSPSTTPSAGPTT